MDRVLHKLWIHTIAQYSHFLDSDLEKGVANVKFDLAQECKCNADGLS